MRHFNLHPTGQNKVTKPPPLQRERYFYVEWPCAPATEKGKKGEWILESK